MTQEYSASPEHGENQNQRMENLLADSRQLALENTRLFDALQTSLSRQAATAEILQVIVEWKNSSQP